jgi:hypothetical protein
MSADPNLLRPDGGVRLDAVGGAPDDSGAYLIRPADGAAARAIGLAGGPETILLVEVAEDSIRESLAEHLTPSHADDSELRTELAVWLAEVRDELPWSLQTRFGAAPAPEDALSAYAERALTSWLRASLRAEWIACRPGRHGSCGTARFKSSVRSCRARSAPRSGAATPRRMTTPSPTGRGSSAARRGRNGWRPTATTCWIRSRRGGSSAGSAATSARRGSR